MSEEIISVPEVADSGRVLDQEYNEWVSGWQNCFRRQRVIEIFKPYVFAVNGEEKYSDIFYLSPYRRFALYYSMIPAGGNTGDVNVYYEFSYNGSVWFYDNQTQTYTLQLNSTASRKNFVSPRDVPYTPLYFRQKYISSVTPPATNTFSVVMVVDSQF